MRAIMVMFDTLSKRYLENYGSDWVKTPNFKRLEDRCCTFDNFYVGSLPCIPARRELHTGKYNYMHRSWGPLEPFDFSCIEKLKENNIYCHLVTDHSHYFEDGGATYHNRYNTWEGFRGQEGDRWTPQDYAKIPERNSLSKSGISVTQHYANLTRVKNEEDMSSVLTFNAGIDFIENHVNKDNWFLQIESFDPHEPFYVPDKYRKEYGLEGKPAFNWPAYGPIDIINDKDSIYEDRKEYAALISMCDNYLGKVLDVMDRYDMWKDTYLIVNTDHGFLLGEHDFIGKNFGPMYNEVSNIPFFIYNPYTKAKGFRKSLCQTIDIVPTLLDIFNIDKPNNLDGYSLLPVMENDMKVRDIAYFGVHGSYSCATDGEMVYMHANAAKDNTPYVECTLMPTVMRGFFNTDDIKKSEFVFGDKYSNYVKYLKIPTKTFYNTFELGNKLFNLKNDLLQENNLALKEDISCYQKWILDGLNKYDAPKEEYLRLGFNK